jgi:hypothetical protein
MFAKRLSSGVAVALFGGLFFSSVARASGGQATVRFQVASPEVTSGVPATASSSQPPAVDHTQRDALSRAMLETAIRKEMARQRALSQDGKQTGERKESTVLCGLKLYEVTPEADERILMPPADGTVDYKIRRHDSPVCRK